MKLIPSYCRRLFRTAFITRNSIVPGSLNHLGFICKAWKDDPILHLSLSFRHFHSSQWNIFHHHYHFIYSQSLLCASSSLSGFRRNFTLSWEYFLPVSLSSLDILHIMLFFFFFFLSHQHCKGTIWDMLYLLCFSFSLPSHFPSFLQIPQLFWGAWHHIYTQNFAIANIYKACTKF